MHLLECPTSIFYFIRVIIGTIIWQNTDTFEKQQIQTIKFGLDAKRIGTIEAEYSAIDNYTYFQSNATQDQIDNGQETAFVKPFQEASTINHLRVKYTKELKWRRWALANYGCFIKK